MDHGSEACVGFLIAGCDASEGLERAEEVFDQMAPAIDLGVVGNAPCAVGLRRNDGDSSTVIQLGADPIDVEGLVGEQRVELDTLDQRLDADAVVALTRQQNEANEIAERVDQRQDLGGQAAARAANGLILSPPFAPVPCWWTRTMVPSMIAYSKSGSADKLAKIRSKVPFKAHRRKRWKTEFQLPNAAGRSRHGDPVRAIHSTASRNSRLFSPDRPGSPGLPAHSGATRSHCPSLKMLRFKTDPLRFPVLNPISSPRGIPFVTQNVNRP